jgi:hypothetical protein
MKVCRIMAWVACGGTSVASLAAGQPFTNTATLNATVDNSGTNLVIAYSMATTQGWVTLFSANAPDQLGTKAQPVDLHQVPSSMQGQFLVPISRGAPAQFYRLLIEQWPSRGKALVFINGPLDFNAMLAAYGAITNNSQGGTPWIFKQPVEVWIDHLGVYDTNGVLVGGNGGALNGKYGVTSVASQNNPSDGFPLINAINVGPSNDFRVNYLGDPGAGIDEREGIIWSSEVQFYHDVNDFRAVIMNDAFIKSLGLAPQIENNLVNLQYRPDLNVGGGEVHAKPTLQVIEDLLVAGEQFSPSANAQQIPLRTRGPYQNLPSLPPLSFAHGTEAIIADYTGLIRLWTLGTNTGLPSEVAFPVQWTYNILAAVNNGLSVWSGYRYSGNTEVEQQYFFAYRIWSGITCGGTNVPCERGENLRNVMMADVPSNTTADGVFPFQVPAGFSNQQGPTGAQLAGMFIAAVFYDISREAGLGDYKADQIAWKTISMITSSTNLTIQGFGAVVQTATHSLWPDGRYDSDVADVLQSRGVPINGATDFHTYLPAAIGHYPESLDVSSANGFGSSHPESQPSVSVYGNYSLAQNGYTQTNATASDYVGYQFYKHSKYGPCDKLAVTDGTFTVNPNPPFNWTYNNDGTFYAELTDRDLGNLVIFAPGRHIRWMRSRQRCPNESTGFYAEDVRPFGFRVINSTRNGFSFTVSALSSNVAYKTYQLSIVDPSTNTLGAASYNWTFTDFVGNTYPATGPVVQYPAYIDEPFTISIDRVRGGVTNNLTLRERGNDLDRSNGQAFVRNFVP